MKFADEVYEFYRENFSTNSDIASFVFSILKDKSRSDFMDIFCKMGDEEILQMFLIYLTEMVNIKNSEELGKGLGFQLISTRYH